MPRGDRTGPMGEGPMTGRGLGYCTGFRKFTRFRGRRLFRLFSGFGYGRRSGSRYKNRRY